MQANSSSSRLVLAGSLAALGSVLIWSGWIVFTRHGVTTDMPPVTLGLLRYSIPALIMLPLLLRSMGAYRRAGWLRCAIMVCGSGAPFFLICSQAMIIAPAAHVGVMLPGVMPMFVALFAFLLFGERYSGTRLAGYALVLAGVAALGGASLIEAGAGDWRGHVLLLVSAASWACFTLAFKRSGLTAWQAAALINAVSVVIMVAIDAVQGGPRLWTIPWQTLAIQGFAQASCRDCWRSQPIATRWACWARPRRRRSCPSPLPSRP